MDIDELLMNDLDKKFITGYEFKLCRLRYLKKPLLKIEKRCNNVFA